jgi:hypothetical protein
MELTFSKGICIMKKLSELVKVIENNENCVVMEVKKKQEKELIKIGYFSGNETMFRVTKAPKKDPYNNTVTIWHKDGKCFSCHTAESMCDSLHKAFRMIRATANELGCNVFGE